MHLHMHMHTYLSLNYAARSSPRAHTDSHHGRRDEHDNGIASAPNILAIFSYRNDPPHQTCNHAEGREDRQHVVCSLDGHGRHRG
jgi:hypothetical protein